METKLEELLNKIIDMWWNPRWEIAVNCIECNNKQVVIDYRFDVTVYSLNDLSSIDSGFWQFVCEKGLHKNKPCIDWFSILETLLMYSSITPDKTQFILDNVIIPNG